MKKLGFTMVEVIFVIVILGIVASIGSSIVTKIYESYLYSRSINKLQTKTELVLTQISKYLSFRIKGATIARKSDTNITSLQNANENYTILEWIGYDNEGFEGTINGPGWSGFVDLKSSNTTKSQISTPGSHLQYEANVIDALSNGEVNLSDPNSSVGLIFEGLPLDFNVTQYGWATNTSGINHHKYIFRVKNIGNNILKFVENNASIIYEHYKLVWSAYAVVPIGSNGDWDLRLYYNFRPWMGERYRDGSSSLLLEHVSTFKFLQIGDIIRLKLCAFDPILKDLNVTFCKEKVVF